MSYASLLRVRICVIVRCPCMAGVGSTLNRHDRIERCRDQTWLGPSKGTLGTLFHPRGFMVQWCLQAPAPAPAMIYPVSRETPQPVGVVEWYEYRMATLDQQAFV